VSRIRRSSWWLACAGLLLAAGLLVAAEPVEVVALAGRVRWQALLAAFAGTALLALLRGARLSVLTAGGVSLARGSAAAAAAQLATGVLPLRLGELALIPLLRAAGLPGALRALSVIVLARVLDALAVLLWATVAAALLGGHPATGAALLAVAGAALAAGWLTTVWALRRVAPRLRRAPGCRRQAVRQLLRVRREVRALARAPLRAGTAIVLSVAIWAAIWAVTLVLLRGMDLAWPPGGVLLGVLGAAFGSALPISAVGTFGTQEAGWVAALAGAGVEARAALAAGFACHFWSLVFMAAIGVVALVYLAAARPDSTERGLLARLTSLLSSERAP